MAEPSQSINLIDIEILISAIEDHPVLWDKSLGTYKCRNSTVNAWNEVCQHTNPNFQQMDEMGKHSYIQSVMKKWRNVRDTWMRAQKRLAADEMRCGSGATMGRSLIYHDQLRFLEKTVTVCLKSIEPIESSFSHDQRDQKEALTVTVTPTTSATADCDRGRNSNSTNSNKPPSPKRKRKIGNELESHQNMKTLDSLQETERKNDSNRHLSFLRGVIPSMDQFDEEDALEFQAGVIELLQKIRRRKLARQQNVGGGRSFQLPVPISLGQHCFQQQPIPTPKQEHTKCHCHHSSASTLPTLPE